MDVVLCGERSIEWDKASLQQHIKLVSNEQGMPCVHASTTAVCACPVVEVYCAIKSQIYCTEKKDYFF